jgi:hypothetical protein
MKRAFVVGMCFLLMGGLQAKELQVLDVGGEPTAEEKPTFPPAMPELL